MCTMYNCTFVYTRASARTLFSVYKWTRCAYHMPLKNPPNACCTICKPLLEHRLIKMLAFLLINPDYRWKETEYKCSHLAKVSEKCCLIQDELSTITFERTYERPCILLWKNKKNTLQKLFCAPLEKNLIKIFLKTGFCKKKTFCVGQQKKAACRQ